MSATTKTTDKTEKPKADEAKKPPVANEAVNAKMEVTKEGRLRLHVDHPAVAEDAKRTGYWIGTLPSCPYQTVHAGGQTFTRYSGTFVVQSDGSLDRDVPKGMDVYLTDDELKAVMQSIARRMIRITDTTRNNGFMYQRDGSTVRPQHGDRPLGEYLFMVPLEGMPIHGKDEWPEPLICD